MKVLLVTPSYKPAFIYGGPTFSVSKLAEKSIVSAPMVFVTIGIIISLFVGEEWMEGISYTWFSCNVCFAIWCICSQS